MPEDGFARLHSTQIIMPSLFPTSAMLLVNGAQQTGGSLVKIEGKTGLEALLITAGDVNMSSGSINNVADPVNPQDVSTKAYVDGLVSGGGASNLQQAYTGGNTIATSGNTLPVTMTNTTTTNKVLSIGTPTNPDNFTVLANGKMSGDCLIVDCHDGAVPALAIKGTNQITSTLLSIQGNFGKNAVGANGNFKVDGRFRIAINQTNQTDGLGIGAFVVDGTNKFGVPQSGGHLVDILGIAGESALNITAGSITFHGVVQDTSKNAYGKIRINHGTHTTDPPLRSVESSDPIAQPAIDFTGGTLSPLFNCSVAAGNTQLKIDIPGAYRVCWSLHGIMEKVGGGTGFFYVDLRCFANGGTQSCGVYKYSGAHLSSVNMSSSFIGSFSANDYFSMHLGASGGSTSIRIFEAIISINKLSSNN